MITLDTSALIRFFTNDIPQKAQKIKKILEGVERLRIPDVVFPELEYVLLSKSYKANRKKILEAFEFLISNKNISVSKEVRIGTFLYEKTSLDMADCVIVASSHKNKLISFDKKMMSAKEKYF